MTKYYYFGSQRVALLNAEGVSYLETDQLGSTSVTADTYGNQFSTQVYYPFGGVRATSGTPLTDYGFTGQRLDASDTLMYYGARYYDPTLERFTQADTIVPSAGNPQTLNRYSYVYNSPLRYTDPSGHCPPPLCALLYAIFEFFASPQPAGGDLYDSSGRSCWPGCVTPSESDEELAVKVTTDVVTAEVGGKVVGKAFDVAKGPLKEVLSSAGDVIETAKIGWGYHAGLQRFVGLGTDAFGSIINRFGSSAAGDLPEEFAGRRIWALGRRQATLDARSAGELVLNLQDGANVPMQGWTEEKNYDWIYTAIQNQDVFHLVSDVNLKTLQGDAKYPVAIFAKELDALLEAGYTRVGDYLIPPAQPPYLVTSP